MSVSGIAFPSPVWWWWEHRQTHTYTHTKAHTSTQANPRDADANTERHNTELYNVHRFTHTHKGIQK